MSTETQTQHEVPSWMSSKIWAHARDRAGDHPGVARVPIDMGGKATFQVPDCKVFIVGVTIFDAPEGGSEVGRTNLPMPREVFGPMRVSVVLPEYSH